MKKYHVFDCTRTVGFTCTVPFAWMAHVIAFVMTHDTGRFHDYWEGNPNGL